MNYKSNVAFLLNVEEIEGRNGEIEEFPKLKTRFIKLSTKKE